MNVNVPMQPMPVEYKLVRSTDAEAFQTEVNKMLKKGWMFHGPTTHSDKGYEQPMITLEIRPVKMGKMDSNDIVPVSGIIRS